MIITRQFVSSIEARLREKLNFIQVIVGPRQVGKTTGVKQLLSNWNGPSLFVSADAVVPPDANWLVTNWRKAKTLGNGALLVVDEVQKIHRWSETIKMLFDEDRESRNLKIVLLGSASLSLQRDLGESLAGRFEVIRVPHWSYKECKKAFSYSLDQYLQYGGYPSAAELIHDPDRWRIFMQDSIIEPVLSKDILQLTPLAKPALFRQTFELAVQYPGQELSLTKLLGYLQDKGNITTIKYYLELMQKAFLLQILNKFTGKALSSRATIPKILPLTTALTHAFVNPNKLFTDNTWRGRITESAVGAHLATAPGDLYYWREKNLEVDYVFSYDDRLFAVEVKAGRERSRKGLDAFISRHKKAVPVTIDQNNLETFLLLENPRKEIAEGNFS